jgi:hypothetical protein
VQRHQTGAAILTTHGDQGTVQVDVGHVQCQRFAGAQPCDSQEADHRLVGGRLQRHRQHPLATVVAGQILVHHVVLALSLGEVHKRHVAGVDEPVQVAEEHLGHLGHQTPTRRR